MIKPENQQVAGAFKEMVTVAIDAGDVATIWLDMPGKSVNTLTPEMFQALDDAIALVEREGAKGRRYSNAPGVDRRTGRAFCAAPHSASGYHRR